MSLSDQLQKIHEAGRKRIPPEKRAIMTRAIEDQRRSGILDQVIKVGDPLPAFALENARGETVRSQDLLSKGPLVATFFRGQW